MAEWARLVPCFRWDPFRSSPAAAAWFCAALCWSVACCARADEADDLVAYNYYQLALSALERGDLEKAESRLEKVTRLVPTWSQGFDMLGFVRERQSKTGPAIEAFAKALELEPRDQFARQSWSRLGDPPFGKVEPTADCDTYRKGLILLTEQDLDQAIRTVFESARVNPGWIEVRNTLAYLYEMHRTKADALREVRAVLEIAPRDFYARHALDQLEPSGGASSGSRTPASAPSAPTYPQWADDASNTEFEQQLFALVNEERRKRGLGELAADRILTKMAREHSGEMRDKGFFAHESPTRGRREPMDRYMLHATRKPEIIAENVARRWGSRPSLNAENIRRSHADLLKSPHHRENILRPGVTHLGVGIASNDKGDYWITQVFAKLR